MFCEKCGAKIEDGALFCESCGAKVQVEEPVQEQQFSSAQAPQMNPNMMQQGNPNVMPQGNPTIMPQQVPPVMPQMAPPMPKKPMSKGLKLLLTEVAILAVAVFAFFKVGEKTFSPETVANQYFKAESKGDWNMVFDMMDLPESEMLTKEMYLLSVEENKLKDITNYKVTEDSWSQLTEDALVKTFTCEYMPTGEKNMQSETIQLVKQKEKRWLFFDSWKVSPADQLAEDFVITVPQDAEATLEGISLDEIATEVDESEKSIKRYTLPKAFPGTYELVLKAPYRSDYVADISISPYNSVYIDTMAVAEDILDSVAPQCNEVIQKVFENALNNVEYASFCETLGEGVTENFDAQYTYEDRQRRLSQQDDEEYYEVMISDITYKYNYSYMDYDTGNLKLEVTAEFVTDFRGITIWEDWWTGEITRTPMEDWNRSEYFSMQLELVDGQWKLSKIY